MLKLIMSDQHCHDWTAYSHIDANGINNRLNQILNQMRRAYRIFSEECKKTGQEGIVIFGGDLFHTRGKLKPSVLNPTYATIKELQEHYNFALYILAGNHDLEDNDSNEIGNSMQCLQDIKKTYVIAKATEQIADIRFVGSEKLALFPWYSDLNALLRDMEKYASSETTAFIHAPINGVIEGIPNHGLDAKILSELGYKRIWAGHYHKHAMFIDGKVGSIGALTHQTWGDIGTLSGFIIEYSDGSYKHIEDEAPKFIDLLGLSEIGFDCKNKYIRIQSSIGDSEEELKQLKEEMLAKGALEVILLREAKPTIARAVEIVEKTETGVINMDDTISKYTKESYKDNYSVEDLVELEKLHLEIFKEASINAV